MRPDFNESGRFTSKKRFYPLVCLLFLGASTSSGQCYLFSSSKANASLQVQINTFLSKLGPIPLSGGGRSYSQTFLGTYTLKVGSSVQVSTNNLGGISAGYTTTGGEDLTTVAVLVAEPSLTNNWQVTLQASGDLLPGGIPSVLPAASKWVSPSGMAPDDIAVPGNPSVFYPIDQITSCAGGTGGGGGTGGAPSISISNTDLQFAATEGAFPPAQTVTITNGNGGGNLPWIATNIVSWISITETATTLTITVDPTGLLPGPYSAAIVITSAGAGNTPQVIKVNLTVTANAPPVFKGPMAFSTMTPCRVVDTRNAAGPLGGPFLAANSSRSFVIAASSCGIPASAGAYSLNLAVVPKKTLGYVTLWPTGQPQPEVATLTSLDGRIRSNAAIVAAGANGAISVFATDDTDVIVDVNGYFDSTSGGVATTASTGAAAFYPVTPCRIADTRNTAGPLGGPRLIAQGTRVFPILQSTCGLPAGALAYSLNFAAVPNGPLGYLTAWPTGQPQPTVASLNAVTGTVTANAVIVPAGEGGQISVFATNNTDLVIDIDGYFAAPGQGGLSFYAAPPCRIFDSRHPTGTPPFNGETTVNVTQTPCDLPASARAYVFNATVVPPGPFGYLAMWPEGQPLPLTATLNALDGAITSNMAIVPTNNGLISVFGSNPTYLILDNFGYFAP